ncbi:NAD-dependent epimerase/dehydratase family protein [Futiania mangrovi]|uniref:NAD-dependent epimerase/dehydratase family protein n=1 Tax=Futiania mangrovi TaxID=2959716 RepID=A0A9J6PBN2_9PROT|nr:NAD-dependent epimerase/dehydratase family protein [Futiania mangrovii]MCP1335590.1 NAD-dependent epimerase/dehydratase family protein [Futiania mangrovii]
MSAVISPDMGSVLVTGASGFIARHVVLQLLEAGYRVRGTVRSASKGEDLRGALAGQGADAARFSFCEADLDREDGWAEAVRGCVAVLHVASPFPLGNPRDREALVGPARAGTLRVYEAAMAAGAARFVATSSIVAMVYRANRPAEMRFGEGDWTDPEWAPLTAYAVSKTRAEQALWAQARSDGTLERITTVNPGFVLGPALDGVFGTSLEVIGMILTGKYPAVPPTAYPVADVRDVAGVHVRALQTGEAAGRRLLAAGETLSLKEMAETLRAAFPGRARRIPRLQLPVWAVRALAVADPALRAVRADFGVRPLADAAYVTEMTGVRFRPSGEAVVAAAQSLIDTGKV